MKSTRNPAHGGSTFSMPPVGSGRLQFRYTKINPQKSPFMEIHLLNSVVKSITSSSLSVNNSGFFSVFPLAFFQKSDMIVGYENILPSQKKRRFIV